MKLLLTLDEARTAVAHSACRLASRCRTDDPFVIAAMLWGAGELDGLHAHDRSLARRHRRLLDAVIELGYVNDVVDELDGVMSATGLADGRFQRWTPPSQDDR